MSSCDVPKKPLAFISEMWLPGCQGALSLQGTFQHVQHVQPARHVLAGYKHTYGWPEPYIYGILGREITNIQSYIIYDVSYVIHAVRPKQTKHTAKQGLCSRGTTENIYESQIYSHITYMMYHM